LAPSAEEAHPNREACQSKCIKVAAPPLDLPCKRPVTYPGDIITHSQIPTRKKWTTTNDNDMAHHEGLRLRKLKGTTCKIRGITGERRSYKRNSRKEKLT
jgi:hypothetical protein